MVNHDVISMPDKWEYPWYAAWDLAFHCVPLAMVDPDFAKSQLDLMLSQDYLHPTGQIPAYEWNFGDVNPPVHAFAALFLHESRGADLRRRRTTRRSSQRRSPGCCSTSPGGSTARIPPGTTCSRAGSSAWTTSACSTAAPRCPPAARSSRPTAPPGWRCSARTCSRSPWRSPSTTRPTRASCSSSCEHFFWIAAAMDPIGEHPDEMWDEEDGFFYDVLRLPDGTGTPARRCGRWWACCRSAPRPSSTATCSSASRRSPRRSAATCERNRDLLANIADPFVPGVDGRRLLSLVERGQAAAHPGADARRGALPRPARHPVDLAAGTWSTRTRSSVDGVEHRVQYEPAESDQRDVRRQLQLARAGLVPDQPAPRSGRCMQYYRYYGDDLKVECPTGSGTMMTLFEVAQELSRRLVSTFTRDADGRRPVYGGTELFQEDPHWRDLILFYEYFHGDNGAGLGASHQTGWTGVVARLIQTLGQFDADAVLNDRQWPMARPYRRENYPVRVPFLDVAPGAAADESRPHACGFRGSRSLSSRSPRRGLPGTARRGRMTSRKNAGSGWVAFQSSEVAIMSAGRSSVRRMPPAGMSGCPPRRPRRPCPAARPSPVARRGTGRCRRSLAAARRRRAFRSAGG